MARRPTHVLHKLILYRILRAISAADGWGFVYILFEGMTQAGDWVVKIGMSIDLIRRLGEHDRVCPNPARVLLDWISVNFRRRQGTLVIFYFFSRPATNFCRIRGVASSAHGGHLRRPPPYTVPILYVFP